VNGVLDGIVSRSYIVRMMATSPGKAGFLTRAGAIL